MLTDFFGPGFLLGRIADTLTDIAGSVPDPYERRQVRAAADVLRRVARSVAWDGGEAAEDLRRLNELRDLFAVRPTDSAPAVAPPDRENLLADVERALPTVLADPSGVAFDDLLARLAEMNRAEVDRATTGEHYREQD